jgi:hypothetical protein
MAPSSCVLFHGGTLLEDAVDRLMTLSSCIINCMQHACALELLFFIQKARLPVFGDGGRMEYQVKYMAPSLTEIGGDNMHVYMHSFIIHEAPS